ncbi:MAG TPA: hypothetical protein P5076_20375, partial [Myxococcota bacterium]|nr:hypothetical protein [Myxococcota bacterium]
MRAESSRKLRWGLVIGLALTACSTGKVNFTVAEDDAIMQVLATEFSTLEGSVLSLCENRELSDAWKDPGGCQEAHVVRGGGRGLAHSEDEPSSIGCGGCPFAVLAYVKGTWTGAPFAEPVEVEGEVALGDLHEPGGVFGYPFQVYLTCKGDSPACAVIDGELQENGHLALRVHENWADPDAPAF